MQMVADGKVDATFEDQPVVEYYLANTVAGTPLECKLSIVGSPFNPVGYGFAFSSDSTHFLPYTQAIIHLQELGEPKPHTPHPKTQTPNPRPLALNQAR